MTVLNVDFVPDTPEECRIYKPTHCALCKNPIGIGDPVGLFMPPKQEEILGHATPYEDGFFIKCCWGTCANIGTNPIGLWTPTGEVKILEIREICKRFPA